jgi:hypothetical protein
MPLAEERQKTPLSRVDDRWATGHDHRFSACAERPVNLNLPEALFPERSEPIQSVTHIDRVIARRLDALGIDQRGKVVSIAQQIHRPANVVTTIRIGRFDRTTHNGRSRCFQRLEHGQTPAGSRAHPGRRERDQRGIRRLQPVTPELGREPSRLTAEHANLRETGRDLGGGPVARGIDHQDLTVDVQLLAPPLKVAAERPRRVNRCEDHGQLFFGE